MLNVSWEDMFMEASSYYQKHGNLEVTERYKTEKGFALGEWISTQRKIRAGERYGTLTEKRIQALDSIGMVWENMKEHAWNRSFHLAKAYYEKNGNLNIPAAYVTENGIKLGRWIHNLRLYRRSETWKTYLTEERIKALDAIGMVWEYADYVWEKNYNAACAYHRDHGNLDVPVKYVTEDGVALGQWLAYLRRQYKENHLNICLSEFQQKQLNKIGMFWGSAYEAQWNASFAEAEKYFHEHGDLDVPASYVSETGMKLGRWVSNQRVRKEKLTLAQKHKLESIGMIWRKYKIGDQAV
jgi:hypothetical protein